MDKPFDRWNQGMRDHPTVPMPGMDWARETSGARPSDLYGQVYSSTDERRFWGLHNFQDKQDSLTCGRCGWHCLDPIHREFFRAVENSPPGLLSDYSGIEREYLAAFLRKHRTGRLTAKPPFEYMYGAKQPRTEPMPADWGEGETVNEPIQLVVEVIELLKEKISDSRSNADQASAYGEVVDMLTNSFGLPSCSDYARFLSWVELVNKVLDDFGPDGRHLMAIALANSAMAKSDDETKKKLQEKRALAREYPYEEGEATVIGPEVLLVTEDEHNGEEVIFYKGGHYKLTHKTMKKRGGYDPDETEVDPHGEKERMREVPDTDAW